MHGQSLGPLLWQPSDEVWRLRNLRHALCSGRPIMTSVSFAEVLQEPLVLPDLRGGNKESVLQELVDSLATQRPEIDGSVLLDSLFEREKLGSTGIVEGVAIPHGRIAGLTGIAVVVGRHPQGVDFGSLDGSPTRLFFLLVAPHESNGVHLKLLAQVSRLLRDASFRDVLMRARDRRELYQRLVERDAN